MKKILILLLLFIPAISFAQLKSGKYNIVKHSSIVEGKSMFEGEKTLGTCFFFVDIEKNAVTFLASDYVVSVYEIKGVFTHEGSHFYDCTDKKTGQKYSILYNPHKTIKDAGEIMIKQSETWYDFFTVLLDE